jgi:hypothetical protein
MENCIERMLKNAGFTVDHTTKHITIEIHGVNMSIPFRPRYDAYDTMTIEEALDIGEVINADIDYFKGLVEEFIAPDAQPSIEECIKTDDFSKLIAALKCRPKGDEKEKSIIMAGFDSLKNDIETAICDLDMRTFTSQNFDELLDEIVVSGSQNLIEVSSKYSTIKTYGQTKDDTFEAVDSYIKTLMNSGELAFIDFDSWEYEYALKLGAKYS